MGQRLHWISGGSRRDRLRSGTRSALAAIILPLLWLPAPSAIAAVTFTVVQSGPHVVITASGSYDLTGAGALGPGVQSGFINGSLGLAVGGPFQAIDAYFLAANPGPFGAGPFRDGTPDSGDVFGLDTISAGGILTVPAGYVSGTPLAGSTVIPFEDYTSLGLTPGTFVYGIPNDTLTVIVTAPAPTSPNLSLAEKAGYALIEQSLSIVAGIVDHTTCALTAGSYPFSVSVAADGTGSATIDDLGIQSKDNTPPGQSFRGHQIRTEIMTPGDVDDTTVSAPAPAAPRVGDFLYSPLGDVLAGQADFLLDGPNNAYDEHVVKDFFLGPVFGSPGIAGVRDDGLEVITKLDFPRAKWRQVSQYRRPNGGVGRLSTTKELIAPDGFAACGISLLDATVDNGGDGFQLLGTVSVQSAVPPALP